jgi:acyl carrier protein
VLSVNCLTLLDQLLNYSPRRGQVVHPFRGNNRRRTHAARLIAERLLETATRTTLFAQRHETEPEMTTASDVLSFLKTTIIEIKDVDENNIRLESTLDEIALDSLDYVEIQLAIKKQYGVRVSQNDFLEGSIKTIGDFCSFVSTAAPAAKPAFALEGAAS